LIPDSLLTNKIMSTQDSIKEMRRLIVQVSYKARQGHLSSSMSIMEMVEVLFEKVMHFDPNNPDALTNDKFVLSKGHAALTLYAKLYQMGVIDKETLFSYSQYDSILGEHPDRNKVPAVDVSTGSLGHGFPTAVGMAIGFKAQGLKNRVFAIIGDGEANEGSIWEAAFVAEQKNLDNIVCIVDDNDSASHMSNVGDKFAAFGWEVVHVDGHNVEELERILSKKQEKPLFVWAHTIKGKGCSIMEADPEGWHHHVISEQEYNTIMEDWK